ncbi:hypothetical protein LTR08_001543 [Meristemomyces frigidus]|nr:hypothetical protein LTR08_001543 [Meristemomyces frigidus]
MSNMIDFPDLTSELTEAQLSDLYTTDFSDLLTGDDMDFSTDGTVSPADLSLYTDFDQQFPGPAIPQEVVPMLPDIPSQAPVPIPAVIPTGAHYQPAIGWYYPVAAPGSYAPSPASFAPSLDPFETLPINEGDIPIALSAPAPTSYAPQPPRVRLDDYYGTPKSTTVAKKSSRTKRRRVCCGPAAHFDAIANPKCQKTSETSSHTKTRDESRRAAGLSLIVQACVCNTGGPKSPEIKRPKNAFIIFRMMQNKQLIREMLANPTVKKTSNGTVAQNYISSEASRRWKALSAQQKQVYVVMADNEKARHKVLYPNYKFDPRKKTKKAQKEAETQFGAEDCTCGAYEANMAQAIGQDGSVSGDEVESEPEELDDYVPARTSAPKAPVAQMQAPAQHLPETMPDFGFATPAQQAEAASVYASLRARQNATPIVVDDTPVPVRRSSRNRTAVVYEEPTDIVDEEEEDVFETQLSEQMSEANNAPSPHMEGKTKKRPADINTPYNTPPALNTRSRSKGSLGMPTIDESADVGMEDLDNLDNLDSLDDLDDLFVGSYDPSEFLVDYDAEDTIVVAAPATAVRASSRKSSKSSPKRRSSPRHKAASPKGVSKSRRSSVQTTMATRRSPRHSPRRSNK